MAAAKRVVARKSPMSRAYPLSSQQDDNNSSDDEEDREFRLESSDEEEEEEQVDQRRHNGRSSPLDLNARLKSTDHINTTTSEDEDEDEHDDDDDEQHQQQETNIQDNLYINGENEQEDENGEDDELGDDDKTTTTTTTEEYASNEQSILIDSEIVNLAPIQQLFHLFPMEAIQTLLKHMGSDESDIDGVNSDTNEYLESFLESPTSELNISTMVDSHKTMLMNRLEVLCFMRGINCWRHLLFLNKTNVRCLFYDMKQYSRMPSSIHSPFVNLYEMYALDLDEASSGSGDGMDRQDPWAFALQRLMLDHYRIGDLDQLLCECCSIDSLRHLLHSFNLSWMRQHSIVDSDYEDDDVNMSDHQIKTQLIALLLLYVLVIGLKDILSQMSVVFLLELNQFCQLHTSKADKKEQLVNQLLYMAFPNIDPRPSIDDTVTVNDLMASYKMPELVKLCDTRGLAVNGTKIELAERLYAYCHHLPQPGKKKLKKKTTPKKKRKSKSPSRKRKAQQESEEDEPKPRVRRRRQSKRRRSSVSSTTSSDE